MAGHLALRRVFLCVGLALHRVIARRLEEEPERTLRQARRNLRNRARVTGWARAAVS